MVSGYDCLRNETPTILMRTRCSARTAGDSGLAAHGPGLPIALANATYEIECDAESLAVDLNWQLLRGKLQFLVAA